MSQNKDEERKKFTSIHYTVSEAIDALGYGSYQLLLSVWLGMILCPCAIQNYFVIILPYQLNCFLEGLNETSVFVVIILMRCSAPMWGYFADRYGRKPPIVITVLVQLLLTLFTINVQDITLFRIFQVLFACFQSTLPIFFALLVEYSPTTSRVQSVMFLQICWFVGQISVMLCSWLMNDGFFILDRDVNRNIVMAICIPSLSIFMLTCYWFPDSALFLSKAGKEREVGSQMSIVAKLNGKKDVLDQIQITNVLRNDENLKDPCFEFFSLALGKDNFYTSVVNWSLWFLNGIAYYGITGSTLAIVKGSDSCYVDTIETFSVFAEDLEPCGAIKSSDYIYVLLSALAEFPAILIGAILIDAIGRKGIYITCTCAYTVCLAPLIISYCEINQTWITVLLFVARGATMIWFMTNIVFTLEQYATKIRCTGIGTGYGFMSLGSLISFLITHYVTSYSITLTCFVYFSIGVFGLLFSIHMPSLETVRDLSSIGEVTIGEAEAISIEYIPSNAIEIRRKNVGRKRSH